MEKNRQKSLFKISNSTTSDDEIFAILGEVQSDDEGEIDELMNDSDTEYAADEDVDVSGDDSSKEKNAKIQVPNANIHSVEKDTEKDDSTKDNNAKQLKWKKKLTANERKNCDLKGEVSYDFSEHVRPVEVYERILNLEELVNLIVVQSNLYAQQKGRNFLTNKEEIRAFL